MSYLSTASAAAQEAREALGVGEFDRAETAAAVASANAMVSIANEMEQVRFMLEAIRDGLRAR